MPLGRRPGRRIRTGIASVATPVLVAAVVMVSAPGWIPIRIHWGDTLSTLAARYHTTVAELIALNHLPGNGDLIYAGQQLLVPGGPAPHQGPHSVLRWVPYRVVEGDSLDAIAARFHADPRSIARHNHLPSSLIVQLGQTLYIPRIERVGGPPPRRRLVAPTGGLPRGAVRALIIRTARHYGVDPALALAISWQESGFNQDVVSSADAVGAMQVLPSTAAFVSAYLVHRRLDIYNTADNIVAGVALLGLLTRDARLPEAVAGYYQGLGSVRTHGAYPDTRRYVADVLALRHRFAAQL
ncbi:MAG TPA: LysM peptidoglycan-binding domain-containing protein [Mycobacteriales bacterium]|nr:LysM peptidoglycan-binding domain-containing protein [Mycobacteriales bacterium]